MKKCDHTSVGMLVWRSGKILMISRNRPPFGISVPAGHVDGDTSFEEAAKRELQEEVGLRADEIKLVAEGRKENKCRRIDGNWHYWRLYAIEASGEAVGDVEETKGVYWLDKIKLAELGIRTKSYLNGDVSEEDWVASPGLEPVMYEWFKEIKII